MQIKFFKLCYTNIINLNKITYYLFIDKKYR